MVSPDDASAGPERGADERRAVERYERSVRRIVACFDDRPMTLYDRRLVGRVSGRPQAVEVLIWGPVMGEDVAVAVECAQRRQPVEARAVENFAEKLREIAADCGVLYSVSGFTGCARARAAATRHPAVMLISLDQPAPTEEPGPPALTKKPGPPTPTEETRPSGPTQELNRPAPTEEPDRPARPAEFVIPGQRRPAPGDDLLQPPDAEEITELDFLLYLWLRSGGLD